MVKFSDAVQLVFELSKRVSPELLQKVEVQFLAGCRALYRITRIRACLLACDQVDLVVKESGPTAVFKSDDHLLVLNSLYDSRSRTIH